MRDPAALTGDFGVFGLRRGAILDLVDDRCQLAGSESKFLRGLEPSG